MVVEARYVPVNITLELRETVSSMYTSHLSTLHGSSVVRLQIKEIYELNSSMAKIFMVWIGAVSDLTVISTRSTDVLSGKSDPYTVFELNGQRVFKSQTKKKTLNPQWNEDFTVQVVRAFHISECYESS